MKKPLLIFHMPDQVLEKYCTTKDDKKKMQSRMPKEGGKTYTYDTLIAAMNGSEDVRQKSASRMLYPKGNNKVAIEDFTVKKVVGRGAFGKVMLVEKKDTGKIYALKSIRKEDIIDKDQIEHTKTERVILEHCNSNFLVNLEYAFTTPEKIFFVT